MNRRSFVLVTAALAVALSANMGARARAQEAAKPATSEPAKAMGGDMKKDMGKAGEMGKAKPMMGNWYMITSTHTEADCAKAMDEAADKNASWLKHTYCGCMHGDHTCWTTVQAASSDAATNMLPADMRAGAKVQQVDRFTPEMIKAHSKKM
jgi:hypothetical protein